MDKEKLNDFYRLWNEIDPDTLSDTQLHDYYVSLQEEFHAVRDEIARRRITIENRKNTGCVRG